jgi:DNA polymerase-3 subunit delta
MLLRPDALEAQLARALAGIYVVFGDETLLVLETVDRIWRAAREAGFTERTVLAVERSFDWSVLAGVAQSMSLFGDRQLVELRIPGGKPGKDGAEALRALAAAANPDVLVIVTLPRLDAATQKSAWFSALAQAGVAVRVDPVERSALPAWVGARLAAQGQRVAAGEVGRRALQFIAERVEGNLLAAHQEIQKLGLLFPPGMLDEAQIHDAVLNVARYDVFKLNEAMLAGDTARLARMVDGLRGEGEAPVLVLWAMTEEIRMLLRVRRGLAAGKALATLVRENRVFGPRERLVGPAAQRLDAAVLERALAVAAQLDRQVKGLQPVAPRGSGSPPPPADPWDGLFALAMMIAMPQGAAPRAARHAARR